MFIVSRNQNWSPGKAFLNSNETLEGVEKWLEEYATDDAGGVEFYLYSVKVAPQMKYTVIHETRGEVWDGPTNEAATDR